MIVRLSLRSSPRAESSSGRRALQTVTTAGQASVLLRDITHAQSAAEAKNDRTEPSFLIHASCRAAVSRRAANHREPIRATCRAAILCRTSELRRFHCAHAVNSNAARSHLLRCLNARSSAKRGEPYSSYNWRPHPRSTAALLCRTAADGPRHLHGI